MTIKVGDKLPEAKFRVMTAEGPQVKTTDDIFKGKKVVLFAVPGAYTGTRHKMHMPSIFSQRLRSSRLYVDTHRRGVGQRRLRHERVEARHRPAR